MNHESNLIDRQKAFFKNHRERVEVACIKAIQRNIERPTILLLDLTDETAVNLMCSNFAGEKMKDFLARNEDLIKNQGANPAVTSYVPSKVAAKLLPPEYSSMRETLESWSEEQSLQSIPIVVVGWKLISLVLHPKPEIEYLPDDLLNSRP